MIERRKILFGLAAAMAAPAAGITTKVVSNRHNKIALMAVSKEWQWINRQLIPNLPPGVRVVDQRDQFTNDTILLKLEGDGLPDRCRVSPGAEYYHVSVIEAGGKLQFVMG